MGLAPRICLLTALCLPATFAGASTWAADRGIEPSSVRILLDNSASMYPGYRPGGGGPGAAVRLYRDSPAFASWLEDFAKSQSVLGGRKISLSAFTSTGAYSRGDLRELEPFVPLADFRARPALGRAPFPGLNTYLAEALAQASQGFEGLLWLVTDNIVERSQGETALGVRKFFESLRDEPRFRSVHLIKLQIAMEGSQAGTLAVYGILVSDRAADMALGEFDDRVRERLRTAVRPEGRGPLFPGQEHWKLKDLRAGIVKVEAPQLEVVLGPEHGGLLRPGKLHLRLRGRVESRLTQHSVIRGAYSLRPVGSFAPRTGTPEAALVEPFAANLFLGSSGKLERPIPPNGREPIEAILTSKEPLALRTHGFSAWFRSATSGLEAEYHGKVEVSFRDVALHLERSEMHGVFGIDMAPEVFGFQSEQTLAQVLPVVVPVSFRLAGPRWHQALLAALLGILLGCFGLAWFVLRKSTTFRVRISGQAERQLSLRPLGRVLLMSNGQILGSLTRRLTKRARFVSSTDNPRIKLRPGERKGIFLFEIRDEGTVELAIEPISPGASLAEARPESRGSTAKRDRGKGSVPPVSPGGSRSPAERPLPKIPRQR